MAGIFNRNTKTDVNKILKMRLMKMKIREEKVTSLTEFRHQVRSGDLLAYLSLNRPSSDIVSCFQCYFFPF